MYIELSLFALFMFVLAICLEVYAADKFKWSGE